MGGASVAGEGVWGCVLVWQVRGCVCGVCASVAGEGVCGEVCRDGVGKLAGERCGCKEVYRFPHTTYPYSSCICSFFAAALFIFFFNF